MEATQPLTGAAKQHAIDTASLIHIQQWLVAIWVICSIALVTVGARIVIRFITRRKLFLDDYFLLFAMPCIVVATSMLQWGAHAFFANKAIANGIIIPDAADIEEQTQVMLITAVFVDTSWTAIFCVKFSFLALFKMLIRNVSTRLSRYFWCVVVATALTWAFLVSETFILCSRFGWDSLKCSGPSTRLYTPLTALVTVLDIITDVLVVTFPIIILRYTQMDCKQKLGLCAFLCLSVIMILFAAIRVLGAIRPGEAHLDLPWEMFWQLMEACAAVMAASATVFRTVFLRHRRASSPRAAGDGAGGGDDAPPPSPEGERFEVLRTLRTRTPSGVGEEEKDKEGGMEVRECGSRGSEDEGGLLR